MAQTESKVPVETEKKGPVRKTAASIAATREPAPRDRPAL